MQAIPLDSIFNKKGIFSIIENENGLENLDIENGDNIKDEEKLYTPYSVKAFEFKHILIKFDSKLTNCFNNLTFVNSPDLSQIIFDIFLNCLNYLEIPYEDNKFKVHYSFLMTKHWMLIVPRKTTDVKLDNGVLNLNSMMYTMSILVKTKEMKEEILKRGLLNVISLFGYERDEGY